MPPEGSALTDELKAVRILQLQSSAPLNSDCRIGRLVPLERSVTNPTSTSAEPVRVRSVQPLAWTRTLAFNAAVAFTYVAAAAVGFRLAFVAEQITTVWAPTGIAMAALLLGGLRLW